jgi:hypothetical protein
MAGGFKRRRQSILGTRGWTSGSCTFAVEQVGAPCESQRMRALFAALATACFGLAGCGESPSASADGAHDTEPVRTVTLPRPQPEPKGPTTDDDLKACAAGPNLAEARRQAIRDVERGEWRYSTFVSGGEGVATTVPGLNNCLPVLVQGHDRHPQLGFCGDVVGGPFDCSCADAEERWREVYNREIFRLVKGSFARNCVPEDRVRNCERGPPGECEELALTRVQRQSAEPPKLSSAE